MQELSNKQSAAMALLVTGVSVEEASAAVNINASTLHRWLHSEPFASEYRIARRNVIQQATAEVARQAHGAARVMVEIMNTASLPASVRLRAAQSIYAAALQWIEHDDLEQRIAQLENERI